uniref:Uncharacterized protein n=1 Tax=Anopheles darlingi TaxID=43151 RepID=A0A2M4DFG0_ANODA
MIFITLILFFLLFLLCLFTGYSFRFARSTGPFQRLRRCLRFQIRLGRKLVVRFECIRPPYVLFRVVVLIGKVILGFRLGAALGRCRAVPLGVLLVQLLLEQLLLLLLLQQTSLLLLSFLLPATSSTFSA